MKRAEEYYNETEFQEKWKIVRAIKQAQIDAIEETCKVCATNVTFKYNGTIVPEISKESILNCANTLKQQL